MKDDRIQIDDLHDPLDAWLAEAEFPAVSEESTRRLQGEWRAIWQPAMRPTRSAWWNRAAIAAVVCIVSAAGWRVLQRSNDEPVHGVANTSSSAVKSSPVMEPRVEAQPVAQSPRVASRAPTVLELRMLAAIERRGKKQPAQPLPLASKADPPQATATETIDLASLRAVAMDHRRPPADRLDAVVSLLQAGDHHSLNMLLSIAEDPGNRALALRAVDRLDEPPTDRLLARMNDPRIETRMTAAAILGHINGPKTTEKLAEMVLKNQNRREALFALAASDGPEARAFLERAGRSNELASAVASTMAQTAYQ